MFPHVDLPSRSSYDVRDKLLIPRSSFITMLSVIIIPALIIFAFRLPSADVGGVEGILNLCEELIVVPTLRS